MKILMIIAKNGFRDEEFQVPHDYFMSKGITVDVASTEKGDCFGKLGAIATADRSFDDVVIQEYFGIVLVGGPGSKDLVGNSKLEKIVKDAAKQNIVVASICYAAVILAKSGVLKGKKATVWNKDGTNSPILTKEGATYVEEPVVVDGLFVTSRGPTEAQKFAEEIIKVAECSDCWMKK